MASEVSYKNVFDDAEEFNRFNSLLLTAIQEFTDSREGNVTYGEIMYVLECILDSLRDSSEKDALKSSFSKSLGSTPSFSNLHALQSRLVERLLKNNLLSSDDEAYILYGESDE